MAVIEIPLGELLELQNFPGWAELSEKYAVPTESVKPLSVPDEEPTKEVLRLAAGHYERGEIDFEALLEAAVAVYTENAEQ